MINLLKKFNIIDLAILSTVLYCRKITLTVLFDWGQNNLNCKISSKILRARAVVLVFACALVSGCATTFSSSPTEDNDPLEGMNRAMLDFNLTSDRVLLKPAAKIYTKVVPKPVRSGVGNFFSNLWEPMTVINDLLQGKFVYAARDASRFLINSTVGVLGIFDVASRIDLPKRQEDFGQTLAVWGVPSGPYIVLPFFGPSNARDTAGLVPQLAYADAVNYLDTPAAYYASGIRLVDGRASLLGRDELLEAQPDQYLFIRETYRQRRANLISDGNPFQPDDSEDALIDQLLEDE